MQVNLPLHPTAVSMEMRISLAKPQGRQQCTAADDSVAAATAAKAAGVTAGLAAAQQHTN